MGVVSPIEVSSEYPVLLPRLLSLKPLSQHKILENNLCFAAEELCVAS